MSATSIDERVEKIKKSATTYAAAALAISKAKLGPAGWAEHEQWVTDYVVTAAREWAIAQAKKERA